MSDGEAGQPQTPSALPDTWDYLPDAHHDIEDPRKRVALAMYSVTGNVRESCATARISTRTFYRWKDNDPAFREAYTLAKRGSVETLQTAARRRAIDGWLEPVFYKGEVVGHVRKFSDVLLIFLMKAGDPATYRDNPTHTIRGDPDNPVGLVLRDPRQSPASNTPTTPTPAPPLAPPPDVARPAAEPYPGSGDAGEGTGSLLQEQNPESQSEDIDEAEGA